MFEPKTEVIMVGHILEKGIILELYELIKDIDVDVKNFEISFTDLKEGMEKKKPSMMRFYLLGSPEKRADTVKKIEEMAKEHDCGIETVDHDALWKR